MKLTIHRGTHQIGGIAVELSTDTTSVCIDMGDELSMDPDFVSAPLEIPGVTDADGTCDGVLFTHHHGDHVGQLARIRQEIPLYIGALAKDIMRLSAGRKRPADEAFCRRIETMNTFTGGETLKIGDIRITPWSIDHSACDSYLFLIEAQGKRVLYTGDFRMHGFRGHLLPKILRKIGKVDVLITEGTALSRPGDKPVTERQLQQRVRDYMGQYKYVYVLCAATNLERICGLSKAVPQGKYFACDRYQSDLLDLVIRHWGGFSDLYRDLKKTVIGSNLIDKLRDRGFLMTVRDNRTFRELMSQFDPAESIILYSMWDGYRTGPQSTIPDFLKLAGQWAPLHTSGHATRDQIRAVVETVRPEQIIPIHTDDPEMLRRICPHGGITIPADGEELLF